MNIKKLNYYLIIPLFFLKILDIISTIIGLSLGNLGELNPLGNISISFPILFLIPFLLFSILFVINLKNNDKDILKAILITILILLLINSFVVISNFNLIIWN